MSIRVNEAEFPATAAQLRELSVELERVTESNNPLEVVVISTNGAVFWVEDSEGNEHVVHPGGQVVIEDA